MERRKAKSLVAHASQRILLTVDLFGRNELANHAAAGAYGFLLSAAPALLLAAVFITKAFLVSPDDAARLLSSFGSLGDAMDIRVLVQGFLMTPLSGFSGVLAFANLFWTARVFALSIQRGIRVIYSESAQPNPVRSNLLTAAIEGAALLFLLAYALSVQVYRLLEGSGSELRFLLPALRVVPFLGLSALIYFAYRILPSRKPGRKAAFEGAVFASAAFVVTSYLFGALSDLSRYDLLYGVLGALVVALANVYFFFTFFFLGAQMAFAADTFDSLVFARFRRIKNAAADGNAVGPSLERKVFSAPERLLSKYSRALAAGEVLFRQGDSGKEVYYVLSGKIAISLDGSKLADIGPGGMFGEMAYLLAEERTADARSETDTVVLALPPELFDRVLREDGETARHVIEALSTRLKNANERLKTEGTSENPVGS